MTLSSEDIKKLILKAPYPIVFKQFISDFPLSTWSIERWSSEFGDKKIPLRCMKKDVISDEPLWERNCSQKTMSFQDFVAKIDRSEESMYFDYKHVNQWFSRDSEIFKMSVWDKFGFPEKNMTECTFWAGSEGAHTPAHQDTYGFNIVLQLHGVKRWLLFPPETGYMKPTRVPYEESSVYSHLNFYCPENLNLFKGVHGGRLVELCAGDALFVPNGWWHHVLHVSPLALAMNMWMPHENDNAARVSEAIVRLLVTQICKDLPAKSLPQILNPNEDDLGDTPLAVSFLQLETVLQTYTEKHKKQTRVKRQKTSEKDQPVINDDKSIDVIAILKDDKNPLMAVPEISHADLITILKDNIEKFTSRATKDALDGADYDDDDPKKLCMTKAVIDAFSQSDVIDLVKQNLINRII